ncbi:hypothetical protein EG329_002594 [Mollisiaceae sp. DMI_Dod_QoI]|nr:hypothetical protein EG329_002594 [Helotiales sp. DMI_Dod_QoI]
MMGSATGELAAALTDATMSEQLTKSKKRRERRKRKLLEQKQKLLPIDDTESQFDVEQKPFPFLDLPYDIRLMIYKLLFVRPICIVPAVNFYRHRPEDCWIKYSVYRYQWEGHRQELPQWSDEGLPSRDGSPRSVSVEWCSSPTEKQRDIIAKGATNLPSTKVQSDIRGIITHRIEQQDTGSMVIRNSQIYHLPGFFGIKMLRTCKLLRKEGAEILYGDNTFSFDAGVHYAYELGEGYTNHIPGLPVLDGRAPAKKEVAEDIKRSYNTSLLKSIKLSGVFKNWTCSSWAMPGLETILPIYTCVLANACRSLCKVYLDGDVMDRQWDHYHDIDPDLTDHEILHEIVGDFVEGLPQLENLHIGWSGAVHGRYGVMWDDSKGLYEKEKWGYTLEWSEMVQNRPEVASTLEGEQDN